MRSKLSAIFIFFTFFVSSQTIHTKCFVKKGKILLRWAPDNKELFDLAVKNGYKVTRSVLSNGKLIETIIVNEKLKPYEQENEKWASLIKENKNAILIMKALFADEDGKNNSVKEKIEKENMLFGLVLLSCDFDNKLAKTCGLFLSDTTIENAKVYQYKIEINAEPSNIKYKPAVLNVDASKLSTNPKIEDLNCKFKNKNAKLKWNTNFFSDNYGGYDIERSTDSINYITVNKAPVILLTSQYEKDRTEIIYNDTMPFVKTKYFYRIKGINHFGELSGPSNVVSGMSYPELSSFPSIDSTKIIQHQKVFIHWQLEKKEEKENVKQFVVLRSGKDSGPYSTLFKGTSENFTYTDEKPEASNYYKIGAISFGDDTLFSYSHLILISDTIAPATPMGLKAKTDEKGNVTITWSANAEKDLQGYKLFKANSLKEEFVQINNAFIKGLEYRDKLNLKTLSKKIYYALVATDNNFNNSVLSEPVEVKRPDTIAPVAPIIRELAITNHGIKITIIKSSSDDIKNYVLYRKVNSGSDIRIREWKANDTMNVISDTTAELGIGYYYKIVAADEDDNISVSNSPYIKYETGFRKKMSGIVFEVDRKEKFIKLSWNYNEKGAEKFIVYRASKKEPLTIIKTLMFPQQNYIDKTPNMGNTYEYRIKAIYTNGAESVISDAVMVEY